VLRQLGAGVLIEPGRIIVRGFGGSPQEPTEDLFVGLSGVTKYFLLPLLGLLGSKRAVVRGSKRMEEGRPIKAFGKALSKLGFSVEHLKQEGHLPVRIGGPFVGGTTVLEGAQTSKGFSGIIASGAYADRDVRVEVKDRLNAAPYINITLEVMEAFGVHAENHDWRAFSVKAGQRYQAREYWVEGDYSSASYFFAAGAIGPHPVLVQGLRHDSVQADARLPQVLARMGAQVDMRDDGILVSPARLKAIEEDMSDMPDMVPTLALLAAYAEGRTLITGLGGGLLRHKESDRQTNTVVELNRLGVLAEDLDDAIAVTGGPIKPATVETYGDHRMAMSLSLATLHQQGVVINEPEVCSKSFPNYFELFDPIQRATWEVLS
jgi:3-phosphoshikimate 1-carboxyvinyltransferase